MKVYCIGDLHYKLENLCQHNELISIMEEDLQSTNVDFIVILGDVLHNHERVHTSVMNKLYDLFMVLVKYAPTYVLVGNHDYINNRQFLTDNHVLYPLKNKNDRLIIVDRVMCHGDFVFVPYIPDGRFHEALDTVPEWREKRIIFAHQMIDGASTGIFNAKNIERWDEPQVVISGHIHSTQVISYEDGKYNIPTSPRWLYTGACRQITIDESVMKKGPLLIDFDFQISDLSLKKGITKQRREVDMSILKAVTITSLDQFNSTILDEYSHIIFQLAEDVMATIKTSQKYLDLNNKKLIIRLSKKDEENIVLPENGMTIENILKEKIKNNKDLVNYVQFITSQ